MSVQPICCDEEPGMEPLVHEDKTVENCVSLNDKKRGIKADLPVDSGHITEQSKACLFSEEKREQKGPEKGIRPRSSHIEKVFFPLHEDEKQLEEDICIDLKKNQPNIIEPNSKELPLDETTSSPIINGQTDIKCMQDVQGQKLMKNESKDNADRKLVANQKEIPYEGSEGDEMEKQNEMKEKADDTNVRNEKEKAGNSNVRKVEGKAADTNVCKEKKKVADSNVRKEEGKAADTNVRKEEGKAADSNVRNEEGKAADTNEHVPNEKGKAVDTNVCNEEGKAADTNEHVPNEKGKAADTNVCNEKGKTADTIVPNEKGKAADTNVHVSNEKGKAADTNVCNEKGKTADTIVPNEKGKAADTNVHVSNEKGKAADTNVCNKKKKAADTNVHKEKEKAANTNVRNEKKKAGDSNVCNDKGKAPDTNIRKEKGKAATTNVCTKKGKAADTNVCNKKGKAADTNVCNKKEKATNTNIHKEKVKAADTNVCNKIEKDTDTNVHNKNGNYGKEKVEHQNAGLFMKSFILILLIRDVSGPSAKKEPDVTKSTSVAMPSTKPNGHQPNLSRKTGLLHQQQVNDRGSGPDLPMNGLTSSTPPAHSLLLSGQGSFHNRMQRSAPDSFHEEDIKVPSPPDSFDKENNNHNGLRHKRQLIHDASNKDGSRASQLQKTDKSGKKPFFVDVRIGSVLIEVLPKDKNDLVTVGVNNLPVANCIFVSKSADMEKQEDMEKYSILVTPIEGRCIFTIFDFFNGTELALNISSTKGFEKVTIDGKTFPHPNDSVFLDFILRGKEGHTQEKEGHELEKEDHELEKDGHELEKEKNWSILGWMVGLFVLLPLGSGIGIAITCLFFKKDVCNVRRRILKDTQTLHAGESPDEEHELMEQNPGSNGTSLENGGPPAHSTGVTDEIQQEQNGGTNANHTGGTGP